MLSLRLNGTPLVLPPDIKMEVNLNAPISNDQLIAGSFIMPFNLPFCPENDKALNNARFLEVKKTRVYDGGEIFMNGIRKHFGKLVILRITDKYECSFSVVGLSLDLLDKSLRDIDYGASLVLGSTTAQVADEAYEASEEFYPDRTVTFPLIRWDDFYNGTNPDASQRANRIARDPNPPALSLERMEYNNATGTCTEDTSASDWDLISDVVSATVHQFFLLPCFYIRFILESIAGNFGYQIKGDMPADTELNKLILLSDRAMDNLRVILEFEGSMSCNTHSLGAPFPHVEFDTVIKDDNNLYVAADFEVKVSTHGKIKVKIDYELDATPNPSFPIPLLIAFKTQSGAYYQFNDGFVFLEDQVGSVEGEFTIIEAPTGGTFAGGRLFFIPDDPELQDINLTYCKADIIQTFGYSHEINYPLFMPDIKVSELLSDLRKYFNLGFYLNIITEEIRVDFVKDIFSRPAKDLTGKRIGKIQFDLSDSAGYLFEHNMSNEEKDTGAYVTDNDLEGLEVGSNAKEIKPEISPVLMFKGNAENHGESCIHPQIFGTGYSDVFETETTESIKKLAFFRGLKPGTNVATTDIDYFFATSHNRLIDGTVEGNYSLQWKDPDYGLYKQFWNAWVEFILANPERVTMDFDLSEPELQGMELHQKIFEKNQEYIIKNIKALYGARKLEQVQMDLLKINPPE